MIEMTKHVQDSMKDVKFPFILFHDPEDKVCRVDGSVTLMAQSATPEEDKKFVSVTNGLHALIPNKTGLIVPLAIDWCRKYTKG